MVVEIKRQICDGNVLKLLVGAGLSWLEHNHETVNRLNVFPVPDGDTGTNMRLTMLKAYEAVHDMDESHVGIVSDAVAKGALRGARGNSGVILSQLLAGFGQALRGHEIFDTRLFAYAAQKGVEAAYKAVIQPVEGTILTVARAAAEAGDTYAQSNNDLIEMLDVMLNAARKTLQRTPEMLPILKKAGVVDSGGQGLIFILDGMARLLRGETVYFEKDGYHPSEDLSGWQEALEPEDSEGYGYDVQFLMHGVNMDVTKIRADIDAMGWSTLVVGDDSLIKVHVHVHDPGQPISYAIGLGAAIDDVVVENMQQQYENYVVEREARETTDDETLFDGVAVIAVASGDGLQYLFRNELGASAVITGGQTMNPSTEDFLKAIEVLPNEEIILLPNNKNIRLAAEQAVKMVKNKQVRVIPSVSIPQGISAMVAYSGVRDGGKLDDVYNEMAAAADVVITGEITHATRTVDFDQVQAEIGQPIGLLQGELVTAGQSLESVIHNLLKKASADERELITLYYGGEVTPHQAEAVAETLHTNFPKQEFAVVYGGQPLYPYIISIE